jgi:hypothetical protein
MTGSRLRTMTYSNPEGYERFMGRWSARLAPLFVGLRILGGPTRSSAFAAAMDQQPAALLPESFAA